MNAQYQPRARAAMTPTGGGRFPPPLGSTNVRRGFTPRSASRTKAVYGQQVRLKLTPKQQLEIIHRLETGDFQKGVGLNQFYEEFSTGTTTNKITCKQNLFASFASVDPIACSTRNYGSGMAGSMESLISVGSSVISSNATTVEGMDVTSVETGMTTKHLLMEEDNETLPDYIKAFDRLLSTRENYCKQLEEMAEARCAVNFAKLLPQEKIVSFFKSLERIQKILQKYLNGNASDSLKIFMPAQKAKGPPPPEIYCDIENHVRIVDAFYKLREIMEKLDFYLKQEAVDFKLEAKMESFKDLIARLEVAIKSQEKHSIDLKDMIKKTELIDLDENTTPCDSGTEAYEESPSSPSPR